MCFCVQRLSCGRLRWRVGVAADACLGGVWGLCRALCADRARFCRTPRGCPAYSATEARMRGAGCRSGLCSGGVHARCQGRRPGLRGGRPSGVNERYRGLRGGFGLALLPEPGHAGRSGLCCWACGAGMGSPGSAVRPVAGQGAGLCRWAIGAMGRALLRSLSGPWAGRAGPAVPCGAAAPVVSRRGWPRSPRAAPPRSRPRPAPRSASPPAPHRARPGSR